MVRKGFIFLDQVRVALVESKRDTKERHVIGYGLPQRLVPQVYHTLVLGPLALALHNRLLEIDGRLVGDMPVQRQTLDDQVGVLFARVELLNEHAISTASVEHFDERRFECLDLGVHVLVACYATRVVVHRHDEAVALHKGLVARQN